MRYACTLRVPIPIYKNTHTVGDRPNITMNRLFHILYCYYYCVYPNGPLKTKVLLSFIYLSWTIKVKSIIIHVYTDMNYKSKCVIICVYTQIKCQK